MTKDQFEQFYRLVENDRSTTEKLKRVSTKEEYFAVLQQVGNGNGFQFTIDEVKQFVKARAVQQPGSKELSDAELEAVAGGCGTCWGTAPSISDW